MQAVIRTGGQQSYVTAGDILEVEKLGGEIGDTITLDDVLMIANEEDVTVGQPTVADAAVTAKITGQYRGKKILVFRYRPKKRIRVRRGHRQYLTRLEIQSIRFGDLEFVAPEPVVPVPVEPEPEPMVEDLDEAEESGETEAALATEEVAAAEVESDAPVQEEPVTEAAVETTVEETTVTSEPPVAEEPVTTPTEETADAEDNSTVVVEAEGTTEVAVSVETSDDEDAATPDTDDVDKDDVDTTATSDKKE